MMIYCPRCATRLEERAFDGKLRPACPGCGYIAFADPKVAATVLVEHDDRVLLVRRGNDPGRGRWCFPGGYVDFGEDPVAAAARECREEAGLAVADLQLLDVVFDGRVIVITYITRSFSPREPTPGDDADLAAWFPAQDLPAIAFHSVEAALRTWQERLDRASAA